MCSSPKLWHPHAKQHSGGRHSLHGGAALQEEQTSALKKKQRGGGVACFHKAGHVAMLETVTANVDSRSLPALVKLKT